GEIPGELLEEAARMWEALEASMLRRVLLHGDLHHGNLLTGPHGPTVIDPMGVMGDPAFEVYPLLVNPRHAPPEDRVRLLDSRLAIVEAVTGLPLDRLRGWGFCGAVLSACWDAMDGNPPEPGSLAVAEALRRGSP
ncbi:MAG TPA: aminoglycoside phosphotransferase family protein, partial [bacterium]|nr:aminoglycoside phosphotransferase family protein [bacterium]